MAHCLTEGVKTQPFFQSSQRIAFYWPVRGEISPWGLLDYARAIHKDCFLPVMSPGKEKRLHFVSYHGEMLCANNPFAIPQPASHDACVTPEGLDLVFMPLVAFDSAGGRLGMGAGFYDRTFAFMQAPCPHGFPRKPEPHLIGLAYAFQRVAALPKEPWDLPLQGVATEEGFEWFTPNGAR